MVPAFLQGRDPSHRILVFVLDTFTEQSLAQNRAVLHGMAIDANIKVVLINHECTPSSLEQWLHHLLRLCLVHAIDEKNLMICNYVRFKNQPNVREAKSEDMIPATIDTVLSKPIYARYAYCFYQWFGYRFYMYNFVYNYRKYNAHPSMTGLTREVEKIFKDSERTLGRLAHSDQCVYSEKTLAFWDNIYDITTPVAEVGQAVRYHKMAVSLKDYLYDDLQDLL
jgi:hypothetical protein